MSQSLKTKTSHVTVWAKGNKHPTRLIYDYDPLFREYRCRIDQEGNDGDATLMFSVPQDDFDRAIHFLKGSIEHAELRQGEYVDFFAGKHTDT